ncbi:MAG: 50S ribosomal protein L6 [Mycoplasmatales bacterium]|nr:50S ribosomal protein L6 [Mycoplasmatales bacterium]
MSRVGKRVLFLEEGTKINIIGSKVEITGKLGTESFEFSPLIAISVNDKNEVTTTRANDEKHTRQLHGTTNSIIQGMIEGVEKGYKKEILIKGVGYKASLKGNQVEVHAGYSHPVSLEILDGVKIEIPKPVEISVSGTNKQKVGQMAALIRDIRRPSPYSGKGIMYKGEKIIRKVGKAAAK